jgi:hypothetical protein
LLPHNLLFDVLRCGLLLTFLGVDAVLIIWIVISGWSSTPLQQTKI